MKLSPKEVEAILDAYAAVAKARYVKPCTYETLEDALHKAAVKLDIALDPIRFKKRGTK